MEAGVTAIQFVGQLPGQVVHSVVLMDSGKNKADCCLNHFSLKLLSL